MKLLAVLCFALILTCLCQHGNFGLGFQVFANAHQLVHHVASTCPTNPPCFHYSFDSASSIFKSIWGFARSPFRCSAYAYDFQNENDQREVSHRLNSLLSRIVGQNHVVGPVKRQLITKIRNPTKPLVFLFTGDNGVGKTMMANLISLSMSLRCSKVDRVAWNGGCQTGDAALSLHGSQVNIAGVRTTVGLIASHAAKYPNGVIIINEVFLLDPKVFDHLAPLFGRGAHFAGHQDVPLNGLTVILTSDFDKHVGITQSKSVAEIAQLSRSTFSERFGPRYISEMSAHAFLPLSLKSAIEACRQEVLNMPCRIKNVRRVTATDDAIEYIVTRSVGEELARNNGRAIYKTIESVIDGEVLGLIGSEFPPSVSDLHVHISLKPSRDGKDFSLAISTKSAQTGISEFRVLDEL